MSKPGRGEIKQHPEAQFQIKYPNNCSQQVGLREHSKKLRTLFVCGKKKEQGFKKKIKRSDRNFELFK